MSLIHFKDYSSTETPIDADNLNNNFEYLDERADLIETNIETKITELETTKANKETVLYNNATGSNGTITLNESSANYEYIEIFFRNIDSCYNSLKVYQPNGKNITLLANYTTNGVVYIKTKIMNISGVNINNVGAQYSELYNSGSNVTFNNVNQIYITRVVGFK